MTPTIKVLSRPTPNDERFLERWKEVGTLGDDATILVVDQHTRVDDSLLDRYPKVTHVVSPTTGHTHLAFTPGRAKIVSLKGENDFLTQIRSVSEFTIGLILRLARPLDRHGIRLCGSTLGIVGLGRIGKHVSILATTFGMKVLHVDKDSPKWAWDTLFKTSDFISIHLPEESGEVVTAYLISLMKPSAYLVNTSRPGVVAEASSHRSRGSVAAHG